MTDKQIIIDGTKINPNDWLEPYKPIPACEIKDCEHWVYAGNNVYGCRIAEDDLVCDDFNNDDECCMYRQLEYYKEALKAKEQECEELKKELQAQRDFTTQEQRKIYCVAYDKTCETGNECKQKKCVFKDRLKLKQSIARIKELIQKEINDCEHCDDCTSCEYNCCIRQAMQICDEVISE